jgi:hypothetical protein
MNALANLAMLLGVLLIAAGIVVALITGLDVRFLIPSAVAIAAGAGLLWRFGSSIKGPTTDAPTSGPQRSVQKPLNPDDGQHSSKLNRKL